MTEKMNQLMKDVPAIRWTALILLASAMFFGYIFMDILSPLQELLQTSRGWSPDAYGHYAGSETFLNVFVFFLIFAGIILDKMGVRFTAILSGAVMLAGASINYFAVSNAFIGSGAESLMNRFMNLPLEWWNITPFYEGMPASAKMSAIGFMFFGCGVEMAGITVSRGIVKWFKGKEMALAMGVEMAIARVGVAVVVLGSPVLANKISPIDDSFNQYSSSLFSFSETNRLMLFTCSNTICITHSFPMISLKRHSSTESPSLRKKFENPL